MGGATSAQTRVDEDDAGRFPSLPRRVFAFSPLELDHCPCNGRMDLNYRDRLKSGVVDDLLVLLHPLRHHLQTSVCGVVSSPFAPRHRAHLPYERIAPARQSSTLLLLDCDVYCLPLAAREDLPGVEGGNSLVSDRRRSVRSHHDRLGHVCHKFHARSTLYPCQLEKVKLRPPLNNRLGVALVAVWWDALN